MKFKQETYVNGKRKPTVHIRRAEDMVGIIAQVCYLMQSGERIRLSQKTDEDYRAYQYRVERNLPGRHIVNVYTIIK